MKIKNIALIIGALAAFNVTADEHNDRLAKESFSSIQQTQSADFAGYVIQKDLTLVSVDQVNGQSVISNMGNQAVVAASKNTIPGEGTVVKNILTGELASLSGNLTVLLKDADSIRELSEKTGLEAKAAYPGSKLVIFKADPSKSIVESLTQIKNSPLVKSARIEVLETLYQAD